MRKKDLFEQNTVLYNRLQSVSAELDKYKKLYSENISEINTLRKQLADMETKMNSAAEEKAESPAQINEVEILTPKTNIYTPLTDVVLEDAMQYGATIIGKIVLEGTKANNSFADKPNEYSKDLINLVLGKTEVCKSAIYEICKSDADNDGKKAEIDKVYKEAIDYFGSLYKQV